MSDSPAVPNTPESIEADYPEGQGMSNEEAARIGNRLAGNATDTTPVRGYGARRCDDHFHVTIDGGDTGTVYDSWDEAITAANGYNEATNYGERPYDFTEFNHALKSQGQTRGAVPRERGSEPTPRERLEQALDGLTWVPESNLPATTETIRKLFSEVERERDAAKRYGEVTYGVECELRKQRDTLTTELRESRAECERMRGVVQAARPMVSYGGPFASILRDALAALPSEEPPHD